MPVPVIFRYSTSPPSLATPEHLYSFSNNSLIWRRCSNQFHLEAIFAQHQDIVRSSISSRTRPTRWLWCNGGHLWLLTGRSWFETSARHSPWRIILENLTDYIDMLVWSAIEMHGVMAWLAYLFGGKDAGKMAIMTWLRKQQRDSVMAKKFGVMTKKSGGLAWVR